MGLIVGEDTYMTIAEADEYVSKYYSSISAKRTAWNALTTADKEVYMRNSVKAIDSLRIIGRKYDNLQVLQFPRIINEHTNFIDGYYINNEVEIPDDIKYSQVEEALETISPTADTKEAKIVGGIVQSYSIGHLSESYKKVNDDGSIKIIIRSKAAQQYLRKYVFGTYRIE